MVVFLLAVIVFIMLFGGAALAGVAGAIVGCVAFTLFLFWFGISLSTALWTIGIVMALVIVLGAFADNIERVILYIANNRSKRG